MRFERHRSDRGTHRRVANAALGAVATLLSLGAVELGIRSTMPIPARGYGVWAGYPGSELRLKSTPDRFEAVHRYNLFGFRGADFAIETTAARRIACVGDSYTEGLGAREEETWPAQLGRRLRGTEVLNLGDAGSDPERYSRIVNDVALPLAPTDVIVCFLPSDLRNGPEVAPDLATTSFPPLSPPKGTESFPPLNPPKGTGSGFADPFRDGRQWSRPLALVLPGWTYLVERARGLWPIQKGSYWNVYDDHATAGAEAWLAEDLQIPPEQARRLVDGRLRDEIAPEVLEAGRRGEFNPTAIAVHLIIPFDAYRARTSDLRVAPDALRAKTTAWLEWFARVCRQAGVRPWILYFPPPPLVMDGPWGPYADAVYEKAPRVVGDTSVRDLLAETTAALNVDFIDLTATLAHHRDEDLYLRYDTHPTARAYELAAEAVAEHFP